MGKSACAKRRPTWRSVHPTQSSMSSLSLICPLTRAWGTPAWSCCCWTQTGATHAVPTLSLGAWCSAHRQRGPLASTGGRSATTRVAKLPSGMPCQRIRGLILLPTPGLVQPQEGWQEDGLVANTYWTFNEGGWQRWGRGFWCYGSFELMSSFSKSLIFEATGYQLGGWGMK